MNEADAVEVSTNRKCAHDMVTGLDPRYLACKYACGRVVRIE